MSSPDAAVVRPNDQATTPEPSSAPADLSAAALRLAADLDRAVEDGRLDVLAPEALQAVMAAACRLYSATNETGAAFAPLPERSRVMDTDVMVLTSALLRAVNLQVFELGMWQSWTGR
jgi:hypothetical protein